MSWKDDWQDAYDEAAERGHSDPGRAADAALAELYAQRVDDARTRTKENADIAHTAPGRQHRMAFDQEG